MTQETLGAAIGLSFQMVQKYEIGINSVPASRLVEVAKALDVPPSFFFKGRPRARARDPLYKREGFVTLLDKEREKASVVSPQATAERQVSIAAARRGQPDHRRLSRRGRPSGA